MELLKKGAGLPPGKARDRVREDAFAKVVDALKPYKVEAGKLPEDCTPAESLAVAVLYVRFIILAGSLYAQNEEILQSRIKFINRYATRGGVSESKLQTWNIEIAQETQTILAKLTSQKKPNSKDLSWKPRCRSGT